MAKLRLIGDATQVEFSYRETEDGCSTVVGNCLKIGKHARCEWSETYDDIADATQYATDHADGDDVRFGRWKL